MSIWEVTTTGQFFRGFSSATPLQILDVIVAPATVPMSAVADVKLEVKVEATGDVEARDMALHSFERAAGIARLAPWATQLPFSRIFELTEIVSSGSRNVHKSFPATMSIAGSTLGPAEIAAATTAATTWAALAPHVQRRTGLALRWLDRALNEINPTERLASLWIAFETLTDRKKGTAVSNGVTALQSIYPKESSRKIEDAVRKVYKARNDIFHQAKLDVPKVGVRASELCDMLSDLLDDKMGFPARIRSQAHF